MVAGLAADPLLIWPNHVGAELVEDLKGGFVAGKPNLAPELCGRHAGRLAGDTVPAVSPVSRRHFRQRKTPGRLVKRNGSPTVWQWRQTNPSPHRAFSR